MSNFKRRRVAILVGAGTLAFYLGYVQYGFDQPLDQAMNVLGVVTTVSQLLITDSENNEQDKS